MTVYRVKIRVRQRAKPALPSDERRKFHELIEKHGGADVSSKKPTAAYSIGVFKEREKAKAFRKDARAVLSTG